MQGSITVGLCACVAPPRYAMAMAMAGTKALFCSSFPPRVVSRLTKRPRCPPSHLPSLPPRFCSPPRALSTRVLRPGHGRRLLDRPGPAGASNLENCELDCLEPDAFDFTGARYVTEVNLGSNSFRALPERLLWSMPALLRFNAFGSTELTTLPERFFENQSQLQNITVASSPNFGAQQRLPDGLLKGLANLTVLDLSKCRTRHLPSMDDLTVRWVPRCAIFRASAVLVLVLVLVVQFAKGCRLRRPPSIGRPETLRNRCVRVVP